MDTLRGLREIDPKNDVLYLGPGKWLFGTVDRTAESERAAIPKLESLSRIPAKKRGAEWHRRWWLAKAQLQGFRARSLFQWEPGGWLVERVRHAHYDHQNTSDNEFFRQMDAVVEEQRRANAKDLADPGRAREAWKYTFTRSHAPGISLTPKDRVRSGYTRHSIPAA